MKIVGALFGFLILVAVFVVWYRAYRSIKGDDGPLFSMGHRESKKKNSLDDFIAAYKRGEVAAASSTPGGGKAEPKTAAGQFSPQLSAAGPARPAMPVKRDAFVSGATKLAYLACRAGLRDHHIFAHVPLSALSRDGVSDPALVDAEVDLLICNAGLSAVAAIDMIDAATNDGAGVPANAAKAEHLRALDIRYMRLSAKSLPRPDELHALLYKM
jgi:hypothetical protein